MSQPNTERHGGPFARIAEEDENVTSPTDSTFRTTDIPSLGAQVHASRSQPEDRAGVFGEFGSFSQNPFGGRAEDPSALRFAAGPNDDSFPSQYALGRRTSVSAESLNPTSSDSDSWTPPYHPKTAEQLTRLKKSVEANFLFSHLEEDQAKTVLDALVEKPIPAKDIKVITQGDAGDYFYIVEQGHFDVFIHSSGSAQPGPDGMGNKVNAISPGGSFGELALMYNAPRAATVVSKEPGTVWALDRVTFRRILMDAAFKRRRMYEAFLEEVPLLASLRHHERTKIADALDTTKYPAGHIIIREGDRGDSFYWLELGEAEAYKEGIEGPVKHYKRGDYFGELALLDDKPRQATIIAKTDVKLVRLGRAGFNRLLGPVKDLMRRNAYEIPKETPKPEES
ncbi:hypothetical protein LOY94_002942 [Ophidiomyces ophidiicola]|uniref:Uncharacterized protein n=1 Tax=Ophidiomyces ophidiicola TaxID=1387563 RepID=A0ACB8UQJ5_9EURO|nr:hypothetical protein LOZ60_002751 [Ophidiomyces ophidiicola]KAI2143870.1 hypothetical protein LOZ27_003755 [Ophidiomyces ophidiicola]KAI2269600.1 hypothetical protein LOZ10_000767 [Ophidiomyces ophidiicola]KAI2351774.1 hypothetical protein LOY94_002942 [Ophidiomyces ophidiicola]KAI2382805.1 hypothetical protein LOY88_005701 [Ophidiomyces ophidiicola]